jgi:hypothetical protein
MTKSSLYRLGQLSVVLWAVLFTTPQFIINIIGHLQGVRWEFIAFYWLVHIGFLGASIFIAWKYDQPLVRIIALPIFALAGYISFQYLQPFYTTLNPAQMILNIIGIGLLGLNTLIALFGLVVTILNGRAKQAIRKMKWNTNGTLILTATIIWTILISLSYIGFGQTQVIADPKQPNFRVSFWGLPSAGTTYANYNNPDIDAELAIYKGLNACFIFGVNPYYLANANYRSNLSAVLHELAEWDIEFMTDTTVMPLILNEMSGIYSPQGDFITYYYTAEFNDTVDSIMEWVSEQNFTNFRGITLDIEGPNYRNASKIISSENYRKGVISFQNKINQFKAAFPGKEVNGISMEGTMWDRDDGDFDLDIIQLTASNELQLDRYGYMTYHTGSVKPGFSDYRYYYYLEQGIRTHGSQFQPWLGWWYDPKSADDPNVIENPIVYEQTIQQFKIAKSLGVSEVVLAPIRNYLGKNNTEGLFRLQTLLDIKNNGFETFEIPITNNMAFIQDNAHWRKKIYPTYWIFNAETFRDLMAGTPTHWFLTVQIGVGILTGIITASVLFQKKKRELIDEDEDASEIPAPTL